MNTKLSFLTTIGRTSLKSGMGRVKPRLQFRWIAAGLAFSDPRVLGDDRIPVLFDVLQGMGDLSGRQTQRHGNGVAVPTLFSVIPDVEHGNASAGNFRASPTIDNGGFHDNSVSRFSKARLHVRL